MINFPRLTGSDYTSGLYGHGKKAILDKVKKDADVWDLLRQVGSSPFITEEVLRKMKILSWKSYME